MIANGPRSVREIASWARNNGTTVEEARQRFAQFTALFAIASVATLREHLVFKGGNALDLVWSPNRSTLDLDFSVDHSLGGFTASVVTIRVLLDQGLSVARVHHGIVFAINSVRQQPPGENRTFRSFAVRVGYALADQPHLILKMSKGEVSPQMLPIEISINEPIGRSVNVEIGETNQ